jgi:hypothetical protein
MPLPGLGARYSILIDEHLATLVTWPMTEEQIKHMVDRFLGWRLPDNFQPDAGISFKALYNEHSAYPMKHQPVGTNLFDAGQAAAMVRHMIEGLPPSGDAAR